MLDTSVTQIIHNCTQLDSAGFTEPQIAELSVTVPEVLSGASPGRDGMLHVVSWLAAHGLEPSAALKAPRVLLMSKEEIDLREQTLQQVGLEAEERHLFVTSFLHR